MLGLLGVAPDRPAARPHDRRHEPDGALGDRPRPLATWPPGGSAAALAISTLTTLLFLLLVYRTLPNTEVTTRQVLPGRADRDRSCCSSRSRRCRSTCATSRGLPALKAFGGAAVLLVWLYLMGNIVLLGGAITWWSARGRAARRGRQAAAASGARERRACRARRPGSRGDDHERAARRGSVTCDGARLCCAPAPRTQRVARRPIGERRSVDAAPALRAAPHGHACRRAPATV